MARRTTPLTDTEIKKTKATDKTVKLFDGGGLYLLIKPTGSKGWRFKYRYLGKEQNLSFGPYPAVSLSKARKKRDAARELLADGKNPSAERQIEKREKLAHLQNSFAYVATEWHEQQTDLADKTRQLHWRRLELDVFPAIGSAPITSLTPKTILDKVLRPMENRGVGEMTHRVKSIISRVFRYGVACSYVDRDITIDLTGALKKVDRKHHAAITDPTDVAKLLRAIDEYDGHYATQCALKLAPMFFVRPGELRQAEWDEVDLDQARWTIPEERMKMKQSHIVPLSKQALEILRKLHSVTGTGRYLFPSVRSFHRPISDNTLNAALRRMGYTKEIMTTHGFRAMARTILDEVLQQRIDFIEHQLAHAVKDPLGRAYNRTTHIEGRTQMMQLWSDYLDGLKSGAKVIPIRKIAD